MRTVLTGILAMAAAGALVRADTVRTRDGTEYHGRIVARTPHAVTIETRKGLVSVAGGHVLAVERTAWEAARAEWERRQAALTGDVAAAEALARWCERLGLFAEADETRRAAAERAAKRPSPEPRPERALDAALRWLQRHQSQDGGWHAKEFHSRCNSDPKFPGTCANLEGGEDIGWASNNVGVSGLALMAFLGAGYTHESLGGKYRELSNAVKAGLRYALAVQNPDGGFGPQLALSANYSHAFMTIAVCEAYGMTQFSRLKEPAQRAADYIARAQNDGLGWRYGIKPGENDSSVTTCMVLALKSAKLAGLEVDRKCFDGALAWFDLATNPDTGKVGYMKRDGERTRVGAARKFEDNEALTAAAIAARLFLGVDRSNPVLKLGAQRIAEHLPVWEPTKIDFYYWYWGGLATFQMGGHYWPAFETACEEALLNHQRGSGCAHGSWDPLDAWGSAGGRVYATAICALSLQYYFRYETASDAENK